MFQDNTLVPWRTVRGNIELQLELRGLRSAATTAERIQRSGQHGFTWKDFEERRPYGAVRRHAAARRLLPGHGAGARHGPARRAPGQARRHDPGDASASDLQIPVAAAQAADGGLRHPQHRGGSAAVQPGLRHLAAPRPHRAGAWRSGCRGRATWRSRTPPSSPAMSREIQEDLPWLRRHLKAAPGARQRSLDGRPADASVRLTALALQRSWLFIVFLRRLHPVLAVRYRHGSTSRASSCPSRLGPSWRKSCGRHRPPALLHLYHRPPRP